MTPLKHPANLKCQKKHRSDKWRFKDAVAYLEAKVSLILLRSFWLDIVELSGFTGRL